MKMDSRMEPFMVRMEFEDLIEKKLSELQREFNPHVEAGYVLRRHHTDVFDTEYDSGLFAMATSKGVGLFVYDQSENLVEVKDLSKYNVNELVRIYEVLIDSERNWRDDVKIGMKNMRKYMRGEEDEQDSV